MALQPFPVRTNTYSDTPGRPGHKRTGEQREADLVLLTKLMVQRPDLSHAEAARAINATRPDGPHISREQAKYDKHKVLARFKVNGVIDRDSLRGLVVQQLFFAQREFLDAWEKSKAPKEKTTTKTVQKQTTIKGESGEIPLPAHVSEETAQIETQVTAGNPAFLQGFVQANERLSTMFGLNEPEQVTVTHTFLSDQLRAMANELGVPIERVQAEFERVLAAKHALQLQLPPAGDAETVDGDYSELPDGDDDGTDSLPG